MIFNKNNFVRFGMITAIFALSVSLSACGSNGGEDITTTETTTVATTTATETTTETTTITTTTFTTTTTTEATTIPEPVTEASYSTNNGSADSSSSETVYIGDTGTKYHREDCRTLKGNGHAITLDEALAQGREACKVCKP